MIPEPPPLLRRALLFGSMILCGYCLLLLFLMGMETTLLFPAGGRFVEPSGFAYEEHWLTTEDGMRLHAWYSPAPEPANDRPLVLFFHGNGGELSLRVNLARRWQQFLGADVVLFDYRGYGKSSGRPGELGLYTDARTIYRWVTEERRVDPERIILVGRSLGGAVALELSLHVPHRALVLESTFTSAPDAAAGVYPWLPVRPLMRNRFPSIDRISRHQGPLFIAHGAEDELIPPGHSKRLFARAGEPKQLMIMPNLGHNHAPSDTYYRTVSEFLARSKDAI